MNVYNRNVLYKCRQYSLTTILSLRAWLARDLPILLLFALFALFAMYPVLPAPRSLVLGSPGDNIQHAYLTGWVAQALLLGESPFIDPRLNYPDNLALAATDVSFLSMVLVAPATWVLGPTFSYNLIIFLSSLCSGYFTYLWLVRLTGSRAGGIIAGLAFMLAPYRIVHSYAHLNLVGTHILPLFFWRLDTALHPPSPRERDLWLLGGATFLVGAVSQYYLVLCLVTGATYALLTLLPRPGYILRSGWRLAVSVFFGTLLSILPAFSLLSCGILEPYNVGRTRLWSADPLNFILPPRIHPLWGTWIEQLRPEPYWGEKTLYLGLVAGLLALIPFVPRLADGAAPLWEQARQRRRVWLGVALVAAVFALGTDLWLNNQPLQRDNPIWLPAYYLAQLPLLGSMRVWARFGIITMLFVALLAGVGTTALLGRLHPWRGLALVVLVALVVLDFLPGNAGTTPLTPRPIDRWLADQPGDFAVAFLPAENDVANYQAMFGTLFHGKHLPAFVHSRHMPPAYVTFMLTAQQFPAPEAIARLHALHLRYLLLERRLFTGWRTPRWEEIAAALAQSPELRVVTEVDGFVVVEFTAQAASPIPQQREMPPDMHSQGGVAIRAYPAPYRLVPVPAQ